MEFKLVEPNECYVYRKESERWELGIYRVIFGYRVRANIKDDMWCPVDYCAADNTSFLIQLFAVMEIIMSQLPEDTDASWLFRALPKYEKRPIFYDPCWDKLLEIALDPSKLGEPVLRDMVRG